MKIKSRFVGSDAMMPILTLAACIAFAMAFLSWLGYRASEEWQKTTRLVEERRVDEVTTLLSTALARDMRGVQESILVQLHSEQLAKPYEIAEVVARAFAQFPYPESFFLW